MAKIPGLETFPPGSRPTIRHESVKFTNPQLNSLDLIFQKLLTFDMQRCDRSWTSLQSLVCILISSNCCGLFSPHLPKVICQSKGKERFVACLCACHERFTISDTSVGSYTIKNNLSNLLNKCEVIICTPFVWVDFMFKVKRTYELQLRLNIVCNAKTNFQKDSCDLGLNPVHHSCITCV